MNIRGQAGKQLRIALMLGALAAVALFAFAACDDDNDDADDVEPTTEEPIETEPVSGDIDYGSELDFYSKLPLREGFYAELKYANYQAESFATDREKVIFGLGYEY